MKPTKPGFYWVRKEYGFPEWLPALVTNLGGVQVFGDTEPGDGSEVIEWGGPCEAPPKPDHWPASVR